MPTRAQASTGSAAASPHTPTGLPACLPASAVIAISCSTAGCHGSVRWARSEAIRSAAIVYCVRSLVPIDRKSTTSRNRWASRAAEGTSTITPGLEAAGADSSANSRPRRRSPPSAPSPRSRRRCAWPPGRCRRAGGPGARVAHAGAGRARRGRGSPRPERAKAGACRSPASSVRTTTYCALAEGVEHRAVDAGLLLDAPARPAGRGSTARCGTARRPRSAAATALRGGAASATLASSLTGAPSLVRPGPAQVARAARCSRSATTRRSASSGSGSVSMVPAVPSTRSRVPLAIPARRRPRRRRGWPSWRAMIAVWLVGPPFSVTSACTTSGSSPAVSAGARSSATSTHGVAGSDTPGSGSPTTWATTRRSMSRRSVARSAISPPMLVNTATNCSTAACTRRGWAHRRSATS